MLNPSRIRGLIFDFDGTLADTIPICLEAFRRAAEPYHGRKLSDSEIAATFGPTEDGCARVLAPSDPDALLESFFVHYEDLHESVREPFEGMLSLLEALKKKGHMLGIVTGKGSRSLHLSLGKVGLENAFDAIEAGCDEGPCKDKSILKILAEWRMSPAEVLYVGDTTSDIRSARSADVAIVSAAWSDPPFLSTLQEHGPDVACDSLAGFREWMEGVGIL